MIWKYQSHQKRVVACVRRNHVAKHILYSSFLQLHFASACVFLIPSKRRQVKRVIHSFPHLVIQSLSGNWFIWLLRFISLFYSCLLCASVVLSFSSGERVGRVSAHFSRHFFSFPFPFLFLTAIEVYLFMLQRIFTYFSSAQLNSNQNHPPPIPSLLHALAQFAFHIPFLHLDACRSKLAT